MGSEPRAAALAEATVPARVAKGSQAAQRYAVGDDDNACAEAYDAARHAERSPFTSTNEVSKGERRFR